MYQPSGLGDSGGKWHLSAFRGSGFIKLGFTKVADEILEPISRFTAKATRHDA